MKERVKYRLSVYADLLKVEASGLASVGGGLRGAITKFSAASRKRMLELLAKIQLSFDGAVFVTLTYPGQYSSDWKRWKRDLDVFLKRLLTRFPDAAGIWRLQPQKRGAPHYHLLIWGISWHYLVLRRWIAQVWYDVVGSGDERHLIVGTQCDLVKSRRHAAFYVSKYVAKVDEAIWSDPETGEFFNVGRWWGRFGKLPVAAELTMHLSRSQVVELRRLVAKLLRSRDSAYGYRVCKRSCSRGFCCFRLGSSTYDNWGSLFDSTAFHMILAVSQLDVSSMSS